MLFTETVAPKTLELLTRLMNDASFNHFLLVGGTSLSLQMGHRISIDLDLFTNESFDEHKLAEYLRREYQFE
jgi:putative NADH-flavin reductase